MDHAQNHLVTTIKSRHSRSGQSRIDRTERQTPAAIQCLSCLKHAPEGLNICLCGVWLRPNQSTMDRIKATFAALKIRYYRTLVVVARGMKHGHKQWQMNYLKAFCKKRSNETSRRHLCTEPMAERRDLPNFSVGDRVYGDVCQVPRLHLHD